MTTLLYTNARFAACLSVQHRHRDSVADIGDIADTDDSDDVSNQDVRDVFNVRNDTAGARRAWILQQLESGVRLRVAEIAEHFCCSSKTAQRDIALLKEEGIVEDVGPTRNRYYVLVKDVGQ